MCRFLAYKGAPIVMDELLFQPQNSLIRQSLHALERNDPVNADGFGVGWYSPEVHPEPAVFVSVQPAWSNRNLRSIAPKIRSGAVFAHVRDATAGSVTELNCHPFQFGRLLMMHNGSICHFGRVKRRLRDRLCDEAYDWIQGETDTEHFFALFLHHLLQEESGDFHHDAVLRALRAAIVDLREILEALGIEDHFYLNLAVTDGEGIVATRYDTHPDMPSPTLYHSEGGRFECRSGVCRMAAADSSAERAVLIVSEKLTDVADDWHPVPENHFVVVDRTLRVSLEPVGL